MALAASAKAVDLKGKVEKAGGIRSQQPRQQLVGERREVVLEAQWGTPRMTFVTCTKGDRPTEAAAPEVII